MDDIIFEKDYRETESAEYDKWCDEVFDRAVNCGMLKAYSEAMDKIPKIIVPEDKKNYKERSHEIYLWTIPLKKDPKVLDAGAAKPKKP